MGGAVGSVLRAHASRQVNHPSGRPWLLGNWAEETMAVGRAGHNAIAVIGHHATTERELTDTASKMRATSDLDRWARSLVGSSYLLASVAGQVRVQGTVSGIRRVFHGRVDGGSFAANRADVLAYALGARLDEQRLALHLLEPPILYPLTGQPVWHGVDVLDTTHYLALDGRGRPRSVPWWTPPEPVEPLAEGAPVLREALSAAVLARTRGRGLVSCDLGGVDSTAVACLAASSEPRVIAFTAASADPIADDVVWATRTVRELRNVEHHVIPADEMPLVYHGLLAMDDPLDEPFAGAVDRDRWLIIIRRAAALGSRLHLTGFGGDELLYGSVAHLHGVLRANPRAALRHVRGFAAKYRWSRREALKQLLDTRPYDVWLAGVADTITDRRAPIEGPRLGWGFTPRLPPWATPAAIQAVRGLIREHASGTEPLASRRGHHRELETMRFVSRLARHLDQMAGRFGVSFAAPYHDDRVIEAALAVRPEERVTPWRYKPLLVEAMRGIVPEQSLMRQTKANGTGDEDPGLRRHRGELLALWEDSRLARLGLIDANRVREMCTRPMPPDLQLGVLYQSVACEVWLRSLERVDAPVEGRR
ncbi:MAG TPA: asparagine synthase-related protein [Micromonosporaceae bacterium]|nr:asparagine synthase-related protein [Micromonosporaceae bacterium]